MIRIALIYLASLAVVVALAVATAAGCSSSAPSIDGPPITVATTGAGLPACGDAPTLDECFPTPPTSHGGDSPLTEGPAAT